MYWKFLCLVVLLICCVSCRNDRRILPDEAMGLAPVYLDASELQVSSEDPRPFNALGKIVVKDEWIYINELYTGIHVIDNSDPTNPVTVAFWHITGNVDFTISGAFLYADSGPDLITIDISDIYNIGILSVTLDAYQRPVEAGLFPADYLGFFECADTTRGYLIAWEERLLIEPKCWR